MKKENILVIVLILVAVAGVLGYNYAKTGEWFGASPDGSLDKADNTGSINWMEYNEGLALAKATNKPVFLYFHADWCTYCTKLKKTTFKDEEVLRFLDESFVSISVDSDKNKMLATQWKVRGLQTLWFLKPDNSKISNIPGYVDGNQFLQILKYIHTQSYEKMKFQEFAKSLFES